MNSAPRRVRIPRELHPVAWWIWAIGLATAASCTSNPLLLASLVAVAWIVVVSCRSDGFWSRSFKLYLWLGLIVIVMMVMLLGVRMRMRRLLSRSSTLKHPHAGGGDAAAVYRADLERRPYV